MTTFPALFGAAPAVTARAPGRVNLIGEHTDYNGGFVLPTAIPQRTTIELSRRGDRTVRVASRDVGAGEEGAGIQTYALGEEAPGRGWVDYVQGTTQLLAADGFALGGFDAFLASDVPIGSGLSSSAALLVALLRAFREGFGFDLDDVQIARVAQRVENEFVGAHVGIMDQMASSLADDRTALFLDTRSLEYRRVPIPREAMEIAVINSGVQHSHAGGDYNTRRAECEQASQMLGIGQLRDLGVPDLARLDALPDVLRRRARHVITENARVLEAVEALEARDGARLGVLFAASHASMRDDYEVSVPEIDRLVALADAEPGAFGARLTGGGFGGSIVVLCRAGEAARVAANVAERYRAPGREATVLVPQAI